MEDCDTYKAANHPDSKIHLPALRKIREARRAAVAVALAPQDPDEAQAQLEWDDFFDDRLTDATACAAAAEEAESGEPDSPVDFGDSEAVAAVLASPELDHGSEILRPFGVGGAGISLPRE